MTNCKYGDPFCPCQDGDCCHYEGKDPWPVTLIPCDDCQTEIIVAAMIECSHCGDTVCSDCLADHAKGHLQV